MSGVRPAATRRCEPSIRSPLVEHDGDAGRALDARDLRTGGAARCLRPSSCSRHDRPTSSGSSRGRSWPASSTVTARAEPAMRLRQLDADRPAADHDQMRGQRAVGEDRLVGEVGRLGEARGSAAPPAREPVAMTNARARMRCGAGLQLVRGRQSAPRPSAPARRAPRSARPNRSARWPRSRSATWSITAAKSTLGSTRRRRRRPPPRRRACAVLRGGEQRLDGTQP